MARRPWWGDAWHALCDKSDAEGYGGLTADEKVWLNTRSLIDNTENGGVISYYYNSGADTLADLMEGLDRLGAPEVRVQIERVNALFPGGVPTDLQARNDVIESLEERDEGYQELLDEVDTALSTLFASLEDKLEQFIKERAVAGPRS